MKVFAPVRIATPAPVLVRPKVAPLMMPPSVSCVPATLSVLEAPNETAPVRLLVPVEAMSVPPLSASVSAPTSASRRSSEAPLATVVPAAVVPRPESSVTAKVPAETVVAPEYVFTPSSTVVPVPACSNVPVPSIAPATVSVPVRLKMSAPLFVIAPAPRAPVAPPEPTRTVPPGMVVVPS